MSRLLSSHPSISWCSNNKSAHCFENDVPFISAPNRSLAYFDDASLLVKCSVVQCDAARSSAMQCGVVKCGAVRCSEGYGAVGVYTLYAIQCGACEKATMCNGITVQWGLGAVQFSFAASEHQGPKEFCYLPANIFVVTNYDLRYKSTALICYRATHFVISCVVGTGRDGRREGRKSEFNFNIYLSLYEYIASTCFRVVRSSGCSDYQITSFIEFVARTCAHWALPNACTLYFFLLRR